MEENRFSLNARTATKAERNAFIMSLKDAITSGGGVPGKSFVEDEGLYIPFKKNGMNFDVSFVKDPDELESQHPRAEPIITQVQVNDWHVGNLAIAYTLAELITAITSL